MSTDDKNCVLFDTASQLSNHHLTPFFFNGLHFKTMIHFLEYHKAKMFGEFEIISLVLSAKSSAECTMYMRELNYDELVKWYNEIGDIFYEGLKCKFSQNPYLSSMLVRSNDVDLVYCDGQDGHFGIGITRHEATRIKSNKWPGKNRLGKDLVRLRHQIESQKLSNMNTQIHI